MRLIMVVKVISLEFCVVTALPVHSHLDWWPTLDWQGLCVAVFSFLAIPPSVPPDHQHSLLDISFSNASSSHNFNPTTMRCEEETTLTV